VRLWRKRQHSAQVPPVVARPVVWVPDSVLDATARVLRSQRDHEEVAYWAGIDGGLTATVLTCIAPAATTTAGSFQTSAFANAVVINWLAEHGLVLIAQLHCHPGRFVEHSHGDEVGALTPFENYLSIVVPLYGAGGLGDFSRCGVHRFEDGRFRRLRPTEVRHALRVAPTMQSFRGAHAPLS
jgi:hypothetical protein